MRTAATAARRFIVAATILVTLSGLLAVAPAAIATGVTPSTTSLNLPDLNPKPFGRTTDVVAQVEPSGVTGTVTFYDDQGGTRTELGSAPVTNNPYVIGMRIATFTLAADLPLGAYHLVAVYSGDDTYAGSESSPLVNVTVGPRPTTLHLVVSSPYDGSGASAQKGDLLSVTANVLDAGAYTPNPLPITGSVAIKVDGTTVATIAPNSGTSLPTAAWTTGSHAIDAVYDPGTGTDYSGSADGTTVQIVADTVDATGIGLQFATFYPYKDGYRDTVAVRGNRLETISVSIRIYSPTGTRVKLVAIPAGTGPYSTAWNGRNSAGSMLAAGKYKVVQVLTDTAGMHRTVTSYVTLSAKKLYTYTATYTKNAKYQASKQGSGWVAWAFTLPSATVYKSLHFYVYGKTSIAYYMGGFGPQDFTYCSYAEWGPGCATRYNYLPIAYGWASVTGSVTADRYGHTVRLYAWGGSGATYVVYGRVKVTYAVLK